MSTRDHPRGGVGSPPINGYPAYWVKYETVDGVIFPATLKPHSTCGEFIRVEQCLFYDETTEKGSKHTSKTIRMHCDRPGCEVCSEKWAEHEANRCTERLKDGATAYWRHGVKLGFARHWAISPPQEWAKGLIKEKGLFGIAQLRKKAVNLVKRAGVRGGAVVVHPWRQDNHSKGWYLSPHIHVVGYGVMMHSDKFFEMSGGWVYHNKGVRKSIFGTMKYLLSHAGIADGRHTVTYFGLFSYNKLAKKVIKTIKETSVCSECGRDLFSFYKGLDDKVDYSKPCKISKRKAEVVEYLIIERTLSKIDETTTKQVSL